MLIDSVVRVGYMPLTSNAILVNEAEGKNDVSSRHGYFGVFFIMKS